MTTRGWGAPDTAKTFKRARELCEQLGDTKELLPALYGEWIQTITGGDISAGQDAAIELLRLSEEQEDSAGIVNAHRCLCFCSLLSGNLASAGRYIEDGLKVYDPKGHRSLGYRFAHDPLVSLLSQRALIESLTGYGERALETCTEAIGYATELAHLPSRIFATWISGALPAAIRRDIESAERHSREILSLSKELNIPTWRAWGSVVNGWALGRHGDPEAAVSLVREGLELQNRQGSLLLSTLLLHLAADLYLATGELGEVQLALDEAKNLVERNNERFWEAEILRLYGEPYVVQNSMARAGDAFNRAIEVA